jgi:hypothetical protein
MRKMFLLLVAFTLTGAVAAQQLFIEAFSAYNLTAYDNDNLETGNYIPLGIRVAGGHEYVQLGLEYRQSITSPEMAFKDPTTFAYQLDETYYGALLRINLSSLPVYRTGFVIKGGAGYYNYTQRFVETTTGLVFNEHEFDRKLGYNAGAGLSLPLYGMFHLELGWQYNIVGRDQFTIEGAGTVAGYDANYHSFQFGFSTNFMFGKKSIECRNRRHKGKGKHGREGWYRKS